MIPLDLIPPPLLSADLQGLPLGARWEMGISGCQLGCPAHFCALLSSNLREMGNKGSWEVTLEAHLVPSPVVFGLFQR